MNAGRLAALFLQTGQTLKSDCALNSEVPKRFGVDRLYVSDQTDRVRCCRHANTTGLRTCCPQSVDTHMDGATIVPSGASFPASIAIRLSSFRSVGCWIAFRGRDPLHSGAILPLSCRDMSRTHSRRRARKRALKKIGIAVFVVVAAFLWVQLALTRRVNPATHRFLPK